MRKKPWLALMLSLIPGMGQVYNGEMAKGFLLLTAFFLSVGPTLNQLANMIWLFPHRLPYPGVPVPSGFFVLAILPTLMLIAARDAWTGANRSRSATASLQETGEEVPADLRGWGVALLVVGGGSLLVQAGWPLFDGLRQVGPPLLIVAGSYLIGQALGGYRPGKDGRLQ